MSGPYPALRSGRYLAPSTSAERKVQLDLLRTSVQLAQLDPAMSDPYLGVRSGRYLVPSTSAGRKVQLDLFGTSVQLAQLAPVNPGRFIN